jgi:hypothetical protein
MRPDQTHTDEAAGAIGRGPCDGMLEMLQRINGNGQGHAGKRHLEAWNHPQADSPEAAIRGLLESLAGYADWHRGRYGVGIGERGGFLGDAWHTLVNTVFCLVARETGRLDVYTLRRSLLSMLEAEGPTNKVRGKNDGSAG